jgi:hypothetical protein
MLRAVKREDVAGHLQNALTEGRIRQLVAADGWPAVCELWDGALWRAARLYLGVVGPSGRGRADERRMQNPAKATPITRSLGPDAVLLLGLWEARDGEAVVVAWESARRVARATRFSLFVPVETLETAQAAGRATYRSSSGEDVRAFSLREPQFIEELLAEFDGEGPGPSMPREETRMAEHDEETGDDGDLEALAEKLASLSEPGEAPADVTRIPIPFEARDVDWASNSWLAKLADVQDWLALDAELDMKDGPGAALLGFFSVLGEPTPQRAYVIDAGHAKLTDLGIALLGARLDQALAHREEFTQTVDDGASASDASKAWRAAWEETPSGVDETREAVHARVDTWAIYQFRDRAKIGRLELNPSYQRGDVWTDKESSELIDSVLRGIPLPSIILNQRRNERSLEIVDGKQRLTSILRFTGSHPDALAFIKKVEKEDRVSANLFHENYRKWRTQVRKRRGLTSADEKANFLPFPYRLAKRSRETGSLAALSGKYYSEMKEAKVQIQGRQETVEDVFEMPDTSYKLSIIQYEDTDVHQIHKVFGLYNRQGKKLNATEVRNAIYHHLWLAKLLLLLSGDSAARSSLAPYLAPEAFELRTIPEMLAAMNVSDSRFNRTKITSWVAALILHNLEGAGPTVPTPGSTNLIEGMMRAVDRPSHPMRLERNCEQFAEHLRNGAALLTALNGMAAIEPKFTHPTVPGVRWEDLPAVAAWTACTLASIAGVEASAEVAAGVREVTKRTERLKKQQAKWQWGYVARVTLELLEAMKVDTSILGTTLEKRYGHNCLQVLEARRAF